MEGIMVYQCYPGGNVKPSVLAIFSDGIFQRIFLKEYNRISINISLNFVPCGLVANKAALVRIVTWGRAGDKPLSETVVAYFTDACIRFPTQ